MSGLHDIRCCKRVQTQGTSMHWHQCFCEAKVRRGEEWFCRMHDPVAIKARRDKRDAKWEAQRVADRARYAEGEVRRARAALCVAACDWMTDAEVSLLAAIPKTCVLSLIYRKP